MIPTIYIYNKKIGTPWADMFGDLYEAELKRFGLDVRRIARITNQKGIFLSRHYSDFLRFKSECKKRSDFFVVMQMNGTSLSDYNWQIDSRQEKSDVNYVDLNLTADENFTRLARKKFNIKNVETVGIPVSFYHNIERVRKENLICIAGKLTADKCVYDSIQKALQYKNYEIAICYPSSSKSLLKYYPKHERITYIEANHNKLLETLSRAEIFICDSLGDTTNVTSVEAIRFGCNTILRATLEVLPYYQNNRRNIDMFNPQSCALRLYESIKKHL